MKMRSGIKYAKSGQKFLWINYNSKMCYIYENEKNEIKSILERLNIIDSDGIADLEYLKDKLNKSNVNIFFEEKGIKL